MVSAGWDLEFMGLVTVPQEWPLGTAPGSGFGSGFEPGALRRCVRRASAKPGMAEQRVDAVEPTQDSVGGTGRRRAPVEPAPGAAEETLARTRSASSP